MRLPSLTEPITSRECVVLVRKVLAYAILKLAKSLGHPVEGVPPPVKDLAPFHAQDPILVRGTLRENLDPTGSHTDEEIWAALEQSYLKEVVERNPEKLLLDTGDGGSNLR